MTIVAQPSNHANIMAAVLGVALTTPFQTAMAGSRTKRLPFPTELEATPFLTVRDGRFAGWASFPALRPTQGTQYARLPGGTGRIFTWQFDVVILYDYAPEDPTTADAVIDQAKADMLAMELIFQQNPNLPDVNGFATCTESRPFGLESAPGSRYGLTIANRPLWLCKLTVEAVERQSVDYFA